MSKNKQCSHPGCDKGASLVGKYGRTLCQTHKVHMDRFGETRDKLSHEPRVGPCVVENCERKVLSKGLCSAHYQQDRSGNDFTEPLNRHTPGQLCMFPECEFEGMEPGTKKRLTKGYCQYHYYQDLRGTKMTPYLERDLLGKKFCKFDPCQRPPLARSGYCTTHTAQNDRTGETWPIGYKPKCAVPWCDRTILVRRILCSSHRSHSKRYGLSQDEYMGMVMDGTCAICKSATRKMHIDHDHACCAGRGSCGECVRGYLCSRCNVGIGMAGDDPAILRAMAEYLER